MKINPFESAQAQIIQAVETANFWEMYKNEIPKILQPEKVHTVYVPVIMDNGETKVFTGYRSQHNAARWPYKGGIRFHPDVNIHEVKALSTWMSIKCSVIDLPLGGGKGGIIVNPKELSKKELEQLSRNYARAIAKDIGPEVDVPAPDVNTNGQIMAWMMDEYSKVRGHYTPGSFTGKPLEAGGSKGRETATSWWGVHSLLQILEMNNDQIAGKKIIVEWAGNVGLNFAEIIAEKWAIITGICDSKWAVYNKDGLDISKIVSLKKSRKSVTEYQNWEKISNQELLEKQCDILVPAALENTITEENAANIQAPVILELANGPITPKADTILKEKNITIIPDILANAGGVMVSYFEQVQNNANFYWEEQEVAEKVEKKMKQATHDVATLQQEQNSTLRIAAYSIALKRIFDAMKMRG